MGIEPIGLATLALGLLCLMTGLKAVWIVFIVTTLFGAAAALLVGSANIQPPHLFLGFALCVALADRDVLRRALLAVRPFEPGFWFACLLVYGLATGFLAPRLMAGSAQIVPLGASEYPDTGYTVPLGPVSSNLTQGIYLSAGFLCFVAVVGVASTRAGFNAVAAGLLAYAVGNCLFAFIDLATYATGTQDVLSFMRNATYTLHNEEEVSGLKRIVGSFTEASAFARSTIGVLAYTGTLWLCNRQPLLTGTLAALSLALLVLSTSSAGLAVAPILLILLYGTALVRCGLRPEQRNSSAAVLLAPPLVILVGLVIALDVQRAATIVDFVDVVLLNKSTTQSAIERTAWNVAAWQNFLDSGGLGVGLGTARASSFIMAMLSNVGLPGMMFYGLFLGSVILRRHDRPRGYPSDIRLAARISCLGLAIGDALVGPSVDQGLFFYVLAGVAVASPEAVLGPPHPATRSTP